MVILSSEEFRNLENNRIQMGAERLSQQLNLQSTIGFGNSGSNPSQVVEMTMNKNGYIGFIMINDRVAASGFSVEDSVNSKHKTMNIHSISVSSEFRGQGLCQQITGEFVKKFGKKFLLYLTVRTESGNENISGIKCYEKQGFIMLPEVYRDHYDGKNNAMVRVPSRPSRPSRNKKTRKRRK